MNMFIKNRSLFLISLIQFHTKIRFISALRNLEIDTKPLIVMFHPYANTFLKYYVIKEYEYYVLQTRIIKKKKKIKMGGGRRRGGKGG